MEKLQIDQVKARNRFNKNEQHLIASLDKVLQANNVPRTYYSLYGYGEDTVCLQNTDRKWEVYIGQRHHKADLKSFHTLKDASKEVIKRLTDKKTSTAIIKDFLLELGPPSRVRKTERVRKNNDKKLDPDSLKQKYA